MIYEILMNIFTKTGYGHRVIKMDIFTKMKKKKNILFMGFSTTGLIYTVSSVPY